MRTTQRRFTKQEDDFIRANYRAMSDRDIGASLSRTAGSVKIHRRRIDCMRIGGQARTVRWDSEKDALILSGKFNRAKDCARSLGITESALMRRSRTLGIKWRKDAKPHRNGYIILGYKGRREILEHRIIAGKSLGRSLLDSELVHHIDLNKRNNEPRNLHVFKGHSEHRKAHCSIESLVPDLLERGIIRFNRTGGIYELCETIK